MSGSGRLAWGALWLTTTVGTAVALWATFVYAPEEKIMGAAQKIFYFHVPAAFVTYIGVAIMLVQLVHGIIEHGPNFLPCGILRCGAQ